MADITVTAGNVDPGNNATIIGVTAGVTITAGQVVYKDTTDGNKYKLADADVLATAAARGISLNGAANNQPIDIIIDGDLNPGGTVVVGEIYLVSTTAGGIAPEADVGSGKYVSVLGIGTTTSNISIKLHVSGVAVP